MYINYFSTKLEKCILKAAITLYKENLTFRANLYPPFSSMLSSLGHFSSRFKYKHPR